MSPCVVVGISGVTNGGKSLLTNRLLEAFSTDAHAILQDDYYYPTESPHHIPCPAPIDHINWDVITSIDMNRMVADVKKWIDNVGSHSRRILILDGFLLFDDHRLGDICDLKFFFTLPKDICHQRRLLRHYEPPDVTGYFEHCVWPMYEQHLERLGKGPYDIEYLNGECDFELNFCTVKNLIKDKLHTS